MAKRLVRATRDADGKLVLEVPADEFDYEDYEIEQFEKPDGTIVFKVIATLYVGTGATPEVNNLPRRILNLETRIGRIPISIPNPSGSEDRTIGLTAVALTITQINDVIVGATSVTWNIKAGTDRNAAGSSLFSSDRVTSSTTGAETTTFDDPKIEAGSWIWLETSSKAGSPNELSITITFTND